MSKQDERIMRPTDGSKAVWNPKYLIKHKINHKEFCDTHGKEQVYADLAVMTVKEFELKYSIRSTSEEGNELDD
jgi:hypothetical protein